MSKLDKIIDRHLVGEHLHGMNPEEDTSPKTLKKQIKDLMLEQVDSCYQSEDIQELRKKVDEL